MIEVLALFLRNFFGAFYDMGYAILHPLSWLDWGNKEAIMRFVYYGGSSELFYAALVIFCIVTAIGVWRNTFMWWCVRVLEAFSNKVGRFIAWAGLIMVMQQIVIVFLQRIFRVSEISFSPLGMAFTRDLSWFGESLKFYNAAIVCLCAAYTLVQGGHVRVDLFYANVKFRTKKTIDMFGALFFMLPMATLIWMYAWYFMWRHLIIPKVSATDTLAALLRKSNILRWNVETIGFSPNGFDGYFLFKILLVSFTFMLYLSAVALFYRSYLERKEGEESEGKYLDLDAAYEADDTPPENDTNKVGTS